MIFISYIREDTETINRVLSHLEENNVEYWFDKKDITPGREWKTEIKQAIMKAEYFIIFLSSTLDNREETYLREELLEAIDVWRKKPPNSGWIIPIKINKCEIPRYNISPDKTLADLQAIELYPDFYEGLKRLVDTIKKKYKDTRSIIKGNADLEVIKNSDSLDVNNLILIYKSLKALLDSGDTSYFHNGDLGHPVYVAGAFEHQTDMWDYADTAQRNKLFNNLSIISKELLIRYKNVVHEKWWYDYTSWTQFCLYVLKVYNKQAYSLKIKGI